MARTAAKIDANQPQVVKTLRDVGCHVSVTSMVGKGFPDLVVVGRNRLTDQVEAVLVELKVPGGRLTSKEREWHAEFPVDGPLIVAYDADDILRYFAMVD